MYHSASVLNSSNVEVEYPMAFFATARPYAPKRSQHKATNLTV